MPGGGYQLLTIVYNIQKYLPGGGYQLKKIVCKTKVNCWPSILLQYVYTIIVRTAAPYTDHTVGRPRRAEIRTRDGRSTGRDTDHLPYRHTVCILFEFQLYSFLIAWLHLLSCWPSSRMFVKLSIDHTDAGSQANSPFPPMICCYSFIHSKKLYFLQFQHSTLWIKASQQWDGQAINKVDRLCRQEVFLKERRKTNLLCM